MNEAVSTATATADPTGPGVERARERLQAYLSPTPLYRSAALSQALGADVWLKVETVTPIASFKLRGALNALLQVREREGHVRVAVTSSTGNHGQGVALAAALLGSRAEIFVPEGAELTKRVMIRLFGASLFLGGYDLDDAKERARTHVSKIGGTFVDDGEEVSVIEGAGTIGLEIAEALSGIDLVMVPMGSGSLASGVAIGVKLQQPAARVVAVQSDGSPAMFESYKAGSIVERPVDTIAGSLVCRVPAATALGALIRHVDDCLLVSDRDLLSAVHTLVAWAHVLVEPGAAAGLAAAWRMRESLQGKRVVLLLTGANIDADMLSVAMRTPPLFESSLLGQAASP